MQRTTPSLAPLTLVVAAERRYVGRTPTMLPWVELSERLLSDLGIVKSRSIESRIGPTDNLAPPEVLTAFRACAPEDARELRGLLQDTRHRLFVKLLILATECVPEPLFDDVLEAGVSTDDPSFNKHFIWPCTIVFGRRRVMNELLRIFETGSDRQKYGVAGAVYWCSMPREHTYWPHHHTHPVPKPPPDEPVDDLHEAFARAATEEFIRNPALDVQRALIPYPFTGLMG